MRDVAGRLFRTPLRIRTAAASTANAAREPVRDTTTTGAPFLGWLRPSPRLSAEDEQLLQTEGYRVDGLLKTPPDRPVTGADSVLDERDQEWAVVGKPVLVTNPRTGAELYWKGGGDVDVTRPIFIPNARLEAELEQELRDHEDDVVDDCVEAARSASPVHTGRFQRGLRAGTYGGHAALVSDDPFSHLVEWGSKNNPPYAPIRSGVDAAGYEFEDARGGTP